MSGLAEVVAAAGVDAAGVATGAWDVHPQPITARTIEVRLLQSSYDLIFTGWFDKITDLFLRWAPALLKITLGIFFSSSIQPVFSRERKNK